MSIILTLGLMQAVYGSALVLMLKRVVVEETLESAYQWSDYNPWEDGLSVHLREKGP